MMSAKLRNGCASAFAAIAILAATSGMATASSASAATLPAPSINTKTCTFYHAHLGPGHDAVDAYTNRRLAWTGLVSDAGDPVSLEPYRDHLNQCWKFIFGFSNFRFEIQISTGKALCITKNPKTSTPDAPLELQACLSKNTQLWIGYGTHNTMTRFELYAFPRLCIGSDTTIQSGAVLYQESCNNSTPRQHWYVNNMP